MCAHVTAVADGQLAVPQRRRRHRRRCAAVGSTALATPAPPPSPPPWLTAALAASTIASAVATAVAAAVATAVATSITAASSGGSPPGSRRRPRTWLQICRVPRSPRDALAAAAVADAARRRRRRQDRSPRRAVPPPPSPPHPKASAHLVSRRVTFMVNAAFNTAPRTSAAAPALATRLQHRPRLLHRRPPPSSPPPSVPPSQPPPSTPPPLTPRLAGARALPVLVAEPRAPLLHHTAAGTGHLPPAVPVFSSCIVCRIARVLGVLFDNIVLLYSSNAAQF